MIDQAFGLKTEIDNPDQLRFVRDPGTRGDGTDDRYML